MGILRSILLKNKRLNLEKIPGRLFEEPSFSSNLWTDLYIVLVGQLGYSSRLDSFLGPSMHSIRDTRAQLQVDTHIWISENVAH